MRIEKLEAARRQLVTAVDLYFAEADPVSVWTLCSAAYNIVRDINGTRQGDPMMVKDQIPDSVPVDVRKRIWNSIQGPENFFKHADRDPEGEIELPEHRVELLLLDAVLTYRSLTGIYLPEFMLLQMWFFANYSCEADDARFREWVASIGLASAKESPSQYRRRMWDEAIRAAEDMARAIAEN